MTLEPTPEQTRTIINAMAHAVGRMSVVAKTGYSPESVTASLPMLLEFAWPLIRDMVLEEAAKHIVRITGSDNYDAQLAEELAQGIRELKGPKP
jgi:hypothetical protein